MTVPLVAPPRPPALFVGRDEERRLFAAHAETLRLVVIYGIGGIGKTSFMLLAAEELARRAGGRLTYHVARPGETVRSFAEAALAQLGVGQRSSNPVSALLAAARSSPVVACLDDAHRLDDALLVGDLVQLALRRERLWLVLASREALPVSPAMIDHLALRLPGLGSAPARTLWGALEELYGPRPAAAAALEPALAAGSVAPMLIKQAFGSPPATAPDTLGIDAMPALDAELLAELCVCRLAVPAAALTAGRDPAEVSAALGRLQRRFLVDPGDGQDRGLRAHDVVRETVARSAHPPGEREHARCLAWWMQREAAGGRVELEVLHHATACGRDELATAILERHAASHGGIFPAPAVVERELSAAITRLGERCELPATVRLLHVRIRARLGQSAAAAAELAALARDARAPRAAIELERGYLASMRGEFDLAAQALGRAVESEELDGLVRIVALAVGADALRCLGDVVRARRFFDDHARLLALAGPVGEGIRRWMEACFAHDSEAYEAAEEAARAARDLLAGLPDALPLLASMTRTVAAALGRGEPEGGEPGGLFDDTLFLRLVARLLRVEELYFHGDLEAAASLASSSQQAAAACGYASIGWWSGWLRGEIERLRGGGAVLLGTMGPAIDAAARHGDRRSGARLHVAHARLLLAHGQLDAARAVAETALAAQTAGPGSAARLHAVVASCDALAGGAELGRRPRPGDVEARAQGFDRAEAELAVAELALWERRPDRARREAERVAAAAAGAGWGWLSCRATLVIAEGAYRCGDIAAAERALAAATEAAVERGYALEAAWAGLLAAGVSRATGDRRGACARLAAVEADATVRGLPIEAEAARVARAALNEERRAGDTPGARLANRMALAEPVTRRVREGSAAYLLSRDHCEEWDGERYQTLIDLVRCRVRVGRRWTDLSRRGALLGVVRALARRPGEVVPVTALVREAWGVGYHPLRHHSRVTTSIMRLRRLLGAGVIAGTGDGYALAVPGRWAVVEDVSDVSDVRDVLDVLDVVLDDREP